jgi:hypothetical protein
LLLAEHGPSLCIQVGRWPYRKLQSLEKLIKSVEEQAAADPLVDVSFTLSELQRFKTEVYTNPEVISPDSPGLRVCW